MTSTVGIFGLDKHETHTRHQYENKKRIDGIFKIMARRLHLLFSGNTTTVSFSKQLCL